ncbi:MAG: hypothetical protein LBD23_19965 [Oscillospiraceae bacterium]|nr:hypothetical protein [Oscillospiraceae bacterium]
MIRNYNDFITALLESGFSGAVGGKEDGVFGLFRYGWGAEDETGLQWHTDDPDTDPWQWRMRVLTERKDIAYSKLFFRKAGYITKEWYPYFLTARRDNMDFEDEYSSGTLSYFSKRIYYTIAENGCLSLQDIKRIAGFKREDNYKVESALTELQMKMYLTICDIGYKVSLAGEKYGFSYTVFDTVESFWGNDVFDKAAIIDVSEAVDRITEQIIKLNPTANEKKIIKFISGV